MASHKIFTIAILAIVLPTMAVATDYIVGDAAGWTVKFDYAAWAKDKVFKVGDTLVFHYNVGDHNVFKVNATSFQNCTIPPPSDALATGNDKVTLATPGKKWYICGVKNHCAEQGMKLVIDVLSDADAAPAPAPSSPEKNAAASSRIMFSGYNVLKAAAVAAAAAMVAV